MAIASTAFDVAEHWSRAPRYGFMTDFSACETLSETRRRLELMLKFHINGLLFYDRTWGVLPAVRCSGMLTPRSGAVLRQRRPWERIPVFVREGAAIPLNLDERGRLGQGMTGADAESWRRLHLYLYPAQGEREHVLNLSTDRSLTLQTSYDGERLQVHVPPLETAIMLRVLQAHVFCPASDCTQSFDLSLNEGV